MTDAPPGGGASAAPGGVGDAGAGAAPTAGTAGRNRAVLRMSALTALSRLTGFARVVVVAAVLGASYLGNTYQSANTVPNILFELFAAGVLQSVLVPVMVEAVDAREAGRAEGVAGAVLGAVLALLAGLVAVGMVAAPWVMRLLVSGVEDPSVRAAQVELGTFLLWFFLPQVLFYGANTVATAVLNARGSFALPVFAPTVNNVVVIATYLLFDAMRGGAAPSLDLTGAEKLVLAGGTTLAVVAFCAVPVAALWMRGFRLVPRWAPSDPVLRRLARRGAWAAGYLALTQALLLAVLYLANGVEGGVVVYQLAFVMFMLPHSLFAVPVFTTAFPALSRFAHADDWSGFAAEVGRAVRSTLLFTSVAAAGLVALSGPLGELMARGNASDQTQAVAGAIAGFALGLPGFSMLLLLTRAAYADGDTRSPTLVNLVVVAVGVTAMSVGVASVSDADRVTALALGYALANTVGAMVLGVVVRHRVHGHGESVPGVVVPGLRLLGAAVVGGVAAAGVTRLIGSSALADAVTSIVAGGVALVVVGLIALWALGGPSPAVAVRTLGGDPGGRRRVVPA
jgi:putative peptidoglycan lipid II flippase